MTAADGRRARLLRWTVIAAALLLGASLCVAAGAYASYREARARWSEVSARLGEEGYDAAESDRRYLVVEARRDEIEAALEVSAISLLVSVLAGRAAVRARRERNSPAGPAG